MRITTKQAACALALLSTIFPSFVARSADDGVNRVTTVPTPEHGQPVAAQADSEGTIHLLYNTADGLRYAKSTDQGLTFGAAIPVVDRAARKPGLEFHGWSRRADRHHRH